MVWLRRLFSGTGALFSLLLTVSVSLLLCAALGLVLWVQSDSSMAHVLRLASGLLPAGQTLTSSDVSGSVHQGGRIGLLRWQNEGLTVDVEALELQWDWRSLLDGELRVARLHAQTVRVQEQGPASSGTLAEVVLPLRVDLQFAVEQLDWVGPPALQLEGLRGHYRFDGQSHYLQDMRVRVADGSYQLDAELQARAPMALSLKASGTVQTPVQIQKVPLQLLAQASLKGTLFGPDALLDLSLGLQPERNKASQLLGTAKLQAQLKPGQPQPVDSARGQWTALDLASLWPQAPRTSLSGQAQVLPDGAGWKADVQLQNSLQGPLDKQHLPLQNARALVLYRNGQWSLSSLQAALGGGSVQAQGSVGDGAAQWKLAASLQGVQPAQLDSRWAGAAISGKLAAQQGAKGIAFDTELSAEPVKAAQAHITRVLAQGHWLEPMLQLDSLLLEGRDAQISGQLQFDTRSYASSGQLRASLPGALITVAGNAAAQSGQGQASATVSDAEALLGWLATVPVIGADMADIQAKGALDLSLGWTGGWQKLGASLQLQARANARRLEVNAQQLSDLSLDLSGNLRDLALRLSGKADVGLQRVAWQAQSHVTHMEAGQWRARLDSLVLKLSDGKQTTPWTMQLQRPLNATWQQNALSRSLALSAGALTLNGPTPGNAQIQWQAVSWSQQKVLAAAKAREGQTFSAPRWASQGQLQGVPLVWLELLGQTKIANLGLRGDLVFGGQWDASSGDGRGLRVNALVQRTSGDLQLLSADSSNAMLAAGLREARVSVQIERDAVTGSVVWASEAGGNARAEFGTRLQTVEGRPLWAQDAPVQATISANLPRLGVWSLVAPVGWRMHGTMEAHASLSGSRSNPVWKGSLTARDLAVRSVVDGIDLSNGVMRLQINGQRLNIVELSLQGAGGASGGKLLVNGSVDWLPGPASAPVAARLRMALDADAQAFRVTARPDQRLVVSGKLNATLVDARLTVRGALVADQALFVLPEDNAPKLGSDVVVNRAKPNAATGKTEASDSVAPRKVQTIEPDLRITLDPGNNFQIQGYGINTRLAGLLTLQTEGRLLEPRLTGELRTVQGTYRAYGQRLNIEQGELRFFGPYDNPVLGILALRPNLPQVVGVQINGTAQFPVMRLYSEPDLPEADKLSWLMLGRASSGGGAEAALLQQAVLALLSGQGKAPTDDLFSALGFDEVSLGQAAVTNLDGSSGTEATVKLGKRLSRDFYIAYERSLAGTLGTFYVFYDLSRRFTLRAESGAQNAVDLIFTTQYD